MARGERKRGDGRAAVVTMEMGERKKVGGVRKCMVACSTCHTSGQGLRRSILICCRYLASLQAVVVDGHRMMSLCGCGEMVGLRFCKTQTER